MIHILSWTTKKHQKTLSRPLHSKLKKIQGLFKDWHSNLRAVDKTRIGLLGLDRIGLAIRLKFPPKMVM